MKKCLNCGTECQDEDLFCPKCGAKLVNENACPKCGNPIDPKDAFCRHCGHKIEKEYKCEQCGELLFIGRRGVEMRLWRIASAASAVLCMVQSGAHQGSEAV